MRTGGGVAAKQGAIVNSGRTGQFIPSGQLTEKQRLFVRCYVRNGGNAMAAARQAGYGGEGSARARSWELLQKPHILAAVRAERERYIASDLANLAAGTMRAILEDENAPRAVQFQAAKWCLERAGHKTDELEDLLNGRKSLNDMTIEELQTFINAGGAALEKLQHDRARVIDITPESAQVSAQPEPETDVLA